MIQNNVQYPTFKARIMLKDVKVAAGQLRDLSTIGSAASGTVSCASGGAMATTASKTLATGFDVLATASAAKSMGTNSSGIVPFALDTAKSVATPATIASADAHPSAMSSLFSSIASFFNDLVKVNNKKKPPTV